MKPPRREADWSIPVTLACVALFAAIVLLAAVGQS